MAKRVIASIVGGEETLHNNVSTVADVTSKLGDAVKGYAITVNGEPAGPSTELSDNDVVNYAPQVKGA